MTHGHNASLHLDNTADDGPASTAAASRHHHYPVHQARGLPVVAEWKGPAPPIGLRKCRAGQTQCRLRPCPKACCACSRTERQSAALPMLRAFTLFHSFMKRHFLSLCPALALGARALLPLAVLAHGISEADH